MDAFHVFFYAAYSIFNVVFTISMAIWLGLWILKSIALYQIAKRRGIVHAWLSWIPVGQEWIIGSLSDQYQYLVFGRIRDKRKMMLGFSAVSWAGTLITIVLLLDFLFPLMLNESVWYGFSYNLAVFGGLMFLFSVIVGVFTIATFVLKCICRYDLYQSCEPANAIAYLVLGTIFGFVDPFLLWACRHKDLGMPPRKPENPFGM